MDRIWMRGKPKAQPDFLTDVKLYDCVPVHHPLRAIKRHLDSVLKNFRPSSTSFTRNSDCPASRLSKLLNHDVVRA